MKLIKTINASTSAYAGNKRLYTDFSFKPSPKTDENGVELPPNKRYYVLRMLNFEGPDRTDYPFIQRNEHICFHRDSDNKVVGVDRIVCPSTPWAKNKLYQSGEKIAKGYCPICEYSFEKNKEAWKVPGQVDRTSARLASDTKSVWTVYLPVYVVSDPHYSANNQHLRVLRLTGDAGKDALERLTTILNDYTNRGINCYNGEMGINIGFLCESVQKTRTNKNGEVSINKKTGQPYVYTENVITDIRPMVKKQYAYPEINDAAIEELDFDGTYGVPATKAELAEFLNRNWLDIGGGEDDFDDGAVSNSDFEAPAASNTSEAAAEPTASTDTSSTEDDFEDSPSDGASKDTADDTADEFDTTDSAEPQSTDDMIGSIIGKSAVKASVAKARTATSTPKKSATKVIPPSNEAIRNEAANGSVDLDDLPF